MNMHTSREEQALNELLSNERMPEGLAQATMARIRAAREAEARSVECTEPVSANSGAEAIAASGTSMDKSPSDEHADGDVRAHITRLASDNVWRVSTEPAHEAEVHSPARQDWHVLDGIPSNASVRTAPARKTPARPTRRHFIQLMAACLAVGCAGAATFAFAHETARVELGETTRVQLGLNRWGTVVRVSCADANLQQAVQDLGLAGLPYEDALACLMEDEAVLSGLSGAEGLLVVVESPNQSQEQDVLNGCRRVAEGASCRAMCRSARQGAGAGMGVGHGQSGHRSGAGNGRGQGSGRGSGSASATESSSGISAGAGRGQNQGYERNQGDASVD